jgi:hypothetical protein
VATERRGAQNLMWGACSGNLQSKNGIRKARAFGDIVANELAELEQRQFGNIAQSLLPFATDTSLDLLGEIFGVARLTQQTAGVDIGDQNFEWYVRSGTFGDINSGRDIVIPSDVRLYTEARLSGPVYISSAVTLPAGGGSVFFSAAALYTARPAMGPRGSSRLPTSPTTPKAASDRCWSGTTTALWAAATPKATTTLPHPAEDVVFDAAAGTFTCYVYGIASDG